MSSVLAFALILSISFAGFVLIGEFIANRRAVRDAEACVERVRRLLNKPLSDEWFPGRWH